VPGVDGKPAVVKMAYRLETPRGQDGETRRIGYLNRWRNATAHQKPTPVPAGIPSVFNLSDIQLWRASCDGLAESLDDMMYSGLLRTCGVAPW
jgi:hypothetical protein